MNRKTLGKEGELAVAEYLQKRGFRISASNYTVRQGEIDLVAEKPGYRLFVEVKTRLKAYFQISLVITPSKQQKIAAAARRYNYEHKLQDDATVQRFDVALLEKESTGYQITYIENAFSPSTEWT